MGVRVKVGFKDSVGVQMDKMGKGGVLPSTLQRLSREGCHVGKGNKKKFGKVAIDPWQLSGPGGQGGVGGRVLELRRRPPPRVRVPNGHLMGA